MKQHNKPNQVPAIPGGMSQDKPRLDSRQLFNGAREVIIEHFGEEYRLRLTSQGKLILTK